MTLDQLNAISPAAFAAVLGGIYEHSPWVAEAVVGQRPFATVLALHAAMERAVRGAPRETVEALIAAHPDLAGKAALAGDLTRHSSDEQASAGLDRLSPGEFARFQKLNSAYKARFGMPFIVSVRRHSRASILEEFERRLGHDAAAEHAVALDEIIRIAALRLDAEVEGLGRLRLAGRLSTHVLDTHLGRPAAGVGVALWELSPDSPARLVTRALTNADGRTDAPLIGARPVPRGRYELVFSVGAYFEGRSLDLPSPAFLDEVPVRFAVAEPEANYHVPLVVTPWSYATYRGS